MRNRHKAEDCAAYITEGLGELIGMELAELCRGIDDPDEWFITVNNGRNPKCSCGREWSVTLREEL